MRDKKRMIYGSIVTALVIILLISLLMWLPSERGNEKPSTENLEYINIPSGAYKYAGEIKIGKNVNFPKYSEIPQLSIHFQNFTYEDAKDMAIRLFSMKILEIYNTSNSYDVKGVNASLSVRKNGYKVFYDKNDAALEKRSVDMSNEKLIEIANESLNKFKEILPKNVEIKFYKVIDGRSEYGEGNDNGVVYTKSVEYKCYYEGFFVGLILEVEVDARGNLAGFQSMPASIEKVGRIKIVAFQEVFNWMKDQLPVPVDPDQIKSVELRDVLFSYLPTPIDGGKLNPAYIISIQILTESGDTVNYGLEIGGIQK